MNRDGFLNAARDWLSKQWGDDAGARQYIGGLDLGGLLAEVDRLYPGGRDGFLADHTARKLEEYAR